jgi:hypothetical protein
VKKHYLYEESNCEPIEKEEEYTSSCQEETQQLIKNIPIESIDISGEYNYNLQERCYASFEEDE